MKKLVILLTLLLASCNLPTSPTPTDVPHNPQNIVTPCLQTSFGDRVDPSILRMVGQFGFEVARLDLQRVDRDSAILQIQDHLSVGLTPLATIRDGNQIRQIGLPVWYELRNEPDLEGPTPEEYRILVEDAVEANREVGGRLFIGVVSNLNDRGFDYLKAIRPFPAGVDISVHRYGDGTFEHPHKGFSSRNAEVKWLKETIGPRKFAVTEFGYPTSDMSEEEQAKKIRQELEFWYQKAEFACIYQINDGPGNTRSHRYGIRRSDGSWKPSANVVNWESR